MNLNCFKFYNSMVIHTSINRDFPYYCLDHIFQSICSLLQICCMRKRVNRLCYLFSSHWTWKSPVQFFMGLFIQLSGTKRKGESTYYVNLNQRRGYPFLTCRHILMHLEEDNFWMCFWKRRTCSYYAVFQYYTLDFTCYNNSICIN